MLKRNRQSTDKDERIFPLIFIRLVLFITILFCIYSPFHWKPGVSAESGKGLSASKKVPGNNSFNPEYELKRLNDLIEKDKENEDAFYNRGWIYEYKGDLVQAEKDYSRAIEINKRYADAYYNRGIIYIGTERYEQAIKDFSETVKLRPKSADAYCNRGNSYFLMGKTDFAFQDYNAALEIDPKDPDLYYNRAIIYITKGEKSKAMEDFQRAARLGHKLARKYLEMNAARP
ncbi:tetratricopeptide repeat protein [Thermodesulfobacteriota bacterium]